MQISKSLVSVDWLHQKIDEENLVILDATIAKVGTTPNKKSKKTIKNARFFDIKNVFSKADSKYPNTFLSSEEFQAEAQNLGIHKDSCIVVYDDLGIYSSPRVWWMFTVMGFNNIAVLNGGLPAWKKANFSVDSPKDYQGTKGNFIANFQPEKIKNTNQVLTALENQEFLITDARSKGRFFGTEPEPRKEVRSGHIPNSVNLPYKELLTDELLKSSEEIKEIITKINPTQKKFIFSCGSGITACILALAAEISNFKNYAVYDGSWTEWGTRTELPIEI